MAVELLRNLSAASNVATFGHRSQQSRGKRFDGHAIN